MSAVVHQQFLARCQKCKSTRWGEHRTFLIPADGAGRHADTEENIGLGLTSSDIMHLVGPNCQSLLVVVLCQRTYARKAWMGLLVAADEAESRICLHATLMLRCCTVLLLLLAGVLANCKLHFSRSSSTSLSSAHGHGQSKQSHLQMVLSRVVKRPQQQEISWSTYVLRHQRRHCTVALHKKG